MNIDLSAPANEESFAKAQRYIESISFPFTSFDAEGLLSKPTTPGTLPVQTDHLSEALDEVFHTRGIRPEQLPRHFEDPERLLSEPTSPGPMSDEALAKAIAEHIRNEKSDNKSRSPPSVYVTALPTRKNSIPEPIPLPSSIFRATDYSPAAAGTTAQRPSSRIITSPTSPISPFSRPTPRLATGKYPSSPNLLSPWSVQSPKPIKRVRTMNRWPPEHEISSSPESQTSESDQAHIATELHKAVQEVAARERELHRAVREAAEMERGLRRRVMVHGGRSSVSKGQE